MTALAIQPSMFTFERIPGLGVIETSDGWCPTNEREIFSVVLGVALHATLAAVGLTEIGSVQTAIGSQPRVYFFMTLETLECGFTRRDGVASGALRRSVQALMSTRERPGRNLLQRSIWPRKARTQTQAVANIVAGTTPRTVVAI